MLDCTTLPRELAEASILGYRKGAFSGAVTDHAGCFEEADGGTLFIDEIGDLAPDLQMKLLRVLERREVQRIQENRPRPVDVRVISATHRNLRDEVAQGRFRLDPYNHLAHVVIDLPSLRERRGDIAQLARHFLAVVSAKVGRELTFTPDALERLEGFHWEGNVRQLKMLIERVGALAHGSIIARDEIALDSGPVPASEVVDDALLQLPLKEAEMRVTVALQHRYCVRQLAETHGNLAEAAERAGYSERGFRDLLKKLGLR